MSPIDSPDVHKPRMLNIRVEAGLLGTLDSAAAAHRVGRSALVRQLLTEGLNHMFSPENTELLVADQADRLRATAHTIRELLGNTGAVAEPEV